MVNFYKQLYSTNENNHIALETNMRFVEIEHVDVMNLNKPISFIKVRKAIFDMGGTKTLNNDGFLALFYQAN